MNGAHRWVIEEPHIPFDRETALMRLRERYREPNIIPAHRLDRPTAGIVVFVRDPAARGAYQMLFQEHRTRKCYECLAPIRPLATPRTGTVVHGSPPRIWPLVRRSRIRKTRGVLCAQEIPGQVNAETAIELEALHARMSARMGMPLQLVARSLAFTDPFTGDPLEFSSKIELGI